MWLSLLKGLVSAVGFLAKFMADRQLIEAGEYKAIAMNNERTLEKVKLARDARRAVKHDRDSVRNDPNNRDDG